MPKRKSPWEGMYTLRSDGRYQGYYRDRNGKRHPVCDKDPEKLYHKIEAKIAENATAQTFSQLVDAWERDCWDKLSPGTQVSYQSKVRYAREEFADTPIVDIQAYDIQRHLDRMAAQGYSPQTITTQRIIYNKLFVYAITTPEFGGTVKINPVTNTYIPKCETPRKRRTSPDEEVFRRIQEEAATAPFGDFVLLLLCTGMRRGEALALQWQDISDTEISITKSVTYPKGHITIGPPKSDSGVRSVPILAPLRPFLVKPEDATPDTFLFHSQEPTRPLWRKTYDKNFSRYKAYMGFTELTAHQLRHGYATMLFEAGVDVYTAQKLLGHSDIAITQGVYTHLRDRQKNKSVDKLLAYTENGIK